MSNVKVVGRRLLIGHTGFVGESLNEKGRWTNYYSRHWGRPIVGRYALAVCAGAPGEKWRANQDPKADRENIGNLLDNLHDCEFDEFVLISTIDADRRGTLRETPYGENRRWLEERVLETIPNSKVLRLPGLFGVGLRKNVLFDIIHSGYATYYPDDTYMWYPIEVLWADIASLRWQNSERVRNIETEPLTMAEIAPLLPNHQCRQPGWRERIVYYPSGVPAIRKVDILDSMRRWIETELGGKPK